MNPTVLTRFAAPDPTAAPLTTAQLVQLLNVLVSSEIQGSYIPYIMQNGTPGVDDQDKSWLELDTQGRPIAVKIFWNGHWRRIYNGMLGEIRGYSGDPGNDFDTNGLGKVGLTYDGWHLCNGRDGTPDLSDRFLLSAHMNNVTVNGYQDGEWVSTLVHTAGEHTGGFREITLDETNTYQPAVNIGTLKVGKYDISGATLDSSGDVWGKPSLGDETKNTNLEIQSDGNVTPNPINVVNPFIAIGWIIFVGYAA